MIRIAILGAGHIADRMAKTITDISTSGYTEINLYAVASRSAEKSAEFAKKFNIQKSYGSYEDMLADKDVDLVYVATPHSHHYPHCMMCLNAGKNVLCEKALTVNAAQTKALFDLAREKNLFIGEAIWTRYMPWLPITKAMLQGGALGKPRLVTANLAYPISNNERVKKPELAGGALLDLGVYVLNFAVMILGQPQKVEAFCSKNEYGVDAIDSYTLSYGENGPMAVLSCNIYSAADKRAIIYCDNGYIEIDNVNCPQKVTARDNNENVIDEVECPINFTGFEYEVLSAAEAISENRCEPTEMPHSESYYIMHLMDVVREKMGIKYPEEIEKL